MGFLNPAFLFALVATTIPLLIHLWHRRQAKRINFGSLIFLTLAHRQTARRIQLYNWIILILRMIIVALITLAICRPLLKKNLFFAGYRTKTSCVIILDHSYSMGYQDADGQRFSLAQEKAIDVLGSLRNGDEATLILMSNTALAIFPQLTSDLQSIRTEIQQSQLTNQTTSITNSLDLAHEILAESKNRNREIYLITDLAGWEETQPIANQSKSKIFILPIGQQLAENTGLTSVTTNTPLFTTDLPVHVEVEVSNFTDAPLAQTSVEVFFNDQKRRELQVPSQSNSMLSVGFTHKFNRIGTHLGYFELPPDRLETDNRRYVVFDIYGEIRTLCVSDNSLYLQTALNPSFTDSMNSSTTVKTELYTNILPTIINTDNLIDISTEDWDLLLIADLDRFSTEMVQKLQSFLRDGKSVILFTGSNLNIDSKLLDWLGVNLSGKINWIPPSKIVLKEEQHPIFDPFLPADFSSELAPRFFHSARVSVNKSAQVLAYLENQETKTPFLVEYKPEITSGYNKGTVIVFNTSAYSLTDTSLLVSPHFLPLIQQAVLYTKSRQKVIDRKLIVGQEFTLDVGGQVDQVQITTPNSTEPLTTEAKEVIHFDQTDHPGFYQVDIYSQGRKEREFFTVNVSSQESDLRPIDIEKAKETISAQQLVEDKELSQRLNRLRQGQEIWGELLTLALLLFGIESLIANRNQKN